MDSPYLIVCIFYPKKQELLQLIKEKCIFGHFYGNVYVIKYQKQGLPHMHLILFLYPDDQIFDVAKIDGIVSTKLLIKDNNLTRELFGIVLFIMFYGICGSQNPNTLFIKKI